MFSGLTAVLLILFFTDVAFTWYVLIGSCVTFLLGATLGRMLPEPAESS